MIYHHLWKQAREEKRPCPKRRLTWWLVVRVPRTSVPGQQPHSDTDLIALSSLRSAKHKSHGRLEEQDNERSTCTENRSNRPVRNHPVRHNCRHAHARALRKEQASHLDLALLRCFCRTRRQRLCRLFSHGFNRCQNSRIGRLAGSPSVWLVSCTNVLVIASSSYIRIISHCPPSRPASHANPVTHFG